MLSVHECSNFSMGRKRRSNELDDIFNTPPQETLLGTKKFRNDDGRSLYETCGEQLMSEEEYWSKDNIDTGSGMEMISDGENSRTTWKIFDSSSSSSAADNRNSYNFTPVGHKGRTIHDFCTNMTVKKGNNASNLNKAVHFEEVDTQPASAMLLSEEPTKVDSRCQGCNSAVKDGAFLLACNFCCRSFCSSRCVCHCELCGGVFCHSTCSTLNYSSVFAKTLCLDCNSEASCRPDYYQM